MATGFTGACNSPEFAQALVAIAGAFSASQSGQPTPQRPALPPSQGPPPPPSPASTSSGENRQVSSCLSVILGLASHQGGNRLQQAVSAFDGGLVP